MKELKTVTFCNITDFAVADGKLEEWFQSVLSSELNYTTIANDLQLTRLRVAVREGQVTPFDLKIQDSDEVYTCNIHGRLNSWPDELFVFDNLLSRLL